MTPTRRHLMMSALLTPALAAPALAGTADQPGAQAAAWPAPSGTIALWPQGVTGAHHPDMTEVVKDLSTTPGVHFRHVKGILNPRLEVFPAQNPNGGAMLIIPGGGFTDNYYDHEGYKVAEFLNTLGVTCFVLFYRLAGDGWDKKANISLIDSVRAMRMIRAKASEFGIDPARLGVVGFSAGGFLTASLATRHGHAFYEPVDEVDAQSAKPLFAAPIYPVQSVDPEIAYVGVAPTLFDGKVTPEIIKTFSPDQNVSPDTAPCFLVHAEDDGLVLVDNATRLRDALKAANIPVETHLFASGGHGFGIQDHPEHPCYIWPQLLATFARSHGLMG